MVFCDKDYLYSTQFWLISMAQPITEFYYPTTQKSYYSTDNNVIKTSLTVRLKSKVKGVGL